MVGSPGGGRSQGRGLEGSNVISRLGGTSGFCLGVCSDGVSRRLLLHLR